MFFCSNRSARSHNLCLSELSLSEALNLHLFGSDSLQEHSENIKHAFREKSDCVIPPEPKILRPVIFERSFFDCPNKL